MNRYMGLSVSDLLDWASGGVETATDIRNFFTAPYTVPAISPTQPAVAEPEPGLFSSENLPWIIGGAAVLLLLLK